MDRRTFMQMSTLPLLAAQQGVLAEPVNGRHRARDLGISIGHMVTGPLNAITDVPGVEVGHSTIIRGDGALEIGKGPVRTGVTSIWPHRNIVNEFLPCGVDAPNGNGELTGMLQARHLGVLNSPICLTNTSSVGMVYDVLESLQPRDDLPTGTPVVGETWDGSLNDIIGRHVNAEHVRAALDDARSGPVQEGAVGGGTGMICYDFKGGIGGASRVIDYGGQQYTVGALVQANHGDRRLLRIDGVPVGEELCNTCAPAKSGEQNSIIMVVATDAPFLSHQLRRLSRRATHGLAKTGSISGNASGDFTIAFSTANKVSRRAYYEGSQYTLRSIEQFSIHPFLLAVSEAVEEAVINAIFMAQGMTGIDDVHVPAIPLAKTLEIMQRYGRGGSK